MPMQSKIPLAPVPMFRTGNNLDEAMAEIKQHTYPYDSNTIHSLVMMYHNTLLKELEQQGRLLPAPPEPNPNQLTLRLGD